MAQDRIGNIVRALVGVPQERLSVLQSVVNGLNSAAAWGEEFQVDLSRFVAGWKPTTSTMTPTSDFLRWEGNYGKLFNRKPDFSQVHIPERPQDIGPVRLIVVVQELLEWTKNSPLQEVQNTLKKQFKCWEYNNLDDSITKSDRDPKNGSYAVWVKDVREADPEFADKSADDLKAENHTGITVLERQLLEADYFFEKGEHLDQQNITLCTGSRDRGGGVPGAGWRGGFVVGWCDSASRFSALRSRRVWV